MTAELENRLAVKISSILPGITMDLCLSVAHAIVEELNLQRQDALSSFESDNFDVYRYVSAWEKIVEDFPKDKCAQYSRIKWNRHV